MTHTASASASAVPTAVANPGPDRAGRVPLACAAVCGPLFLGVGLIQGLTREGFDFTRNSISRLSLGDLGRPYCLSPPSGSPHSPR